jgi:hypothetical protein
LLYYIILVIRIILSQSRMQSAPTHPISQVGHAVCAHPEKTRK